MPRLAHRCHTPSASCTLAHKHLVAAPSQVVLCASSSKLPMFGAPGVSALRSRAARCQPRGLHAAFSDQDQARRTATNCPPLQYNTHNTHKSPGCAAVPSHILPTPQTITTHSLGRVCGLSIAVAGQAPPSSKTKIRPRVVLLRIVPPSWWVAGVLMDAWMRAWGGGASHKLCCYSGGGVRRWRMQHSLALVAGWVIAGDARGGGLRNPRILARP